MALNGVITFFCFGVDYVIVVANRPIMSAEYRIPLLVNNNPYLQCGHSVIAELLVIVSVVENR